MLLLCMQVATISCCLRRCLSRRAAASAATTRARLWRWLARQRKLRWLLVGPSLGCRILCGNHCRCPSQSLLEPVLVILMEISMDEQWLVQRSKCRILCWESHRRSSGRCHIPNFAYYFTNVNISIPIKINTRHHIKCGVKIQWISSISITSTSCLTTGANKSRTNPRSYY